MRSLLLVLALVVPLGVGFSEASAGGKKKGAAPAAECETDSDCVLVIEGCCGCTEGGKQRAVPKRARDSYEKKRQSTCKKTMCPQMISNDQSCAERAVCKEKVCALGQ